MKNKDLKDLYPFTYDQFIECKDLQVKFIEKILNKKNKDSSKLLSLASEIQSKSFHESTFFRLIILLCFFCVDLDDYFDSYQYYCDKLNIDYDEDSDLKMSHTFFYDLKRYNDNHKAIPIFYDLLKFFLAYRENSNDLYTKDLFPIMTDLQNDIINDRENRIIIYDHDFLLFFESAFEKIRMSSNFFLKNNNELFDVNIKKQVDYECMILFLDINNIIFPCPELIAELCENVKLINYPKLYKKDIYISTFNKTICNCLVSSLDNSNIKKFFVILRENWNIFNAIYDSANLRIFFLYNDAERKLLIDSFMPAFQELPACLFLNAAVQFSYILNYNDCSTKREVSNSAIIHFIKDKITNASNCLTFYLENMPCIAALTYNDFVNLFYYACLKSIIDK